MDSMRIFYINTDYVDLTPDYDTEFLGMPWNVFYGDIWVRCLCGNRRQNNNNYKYKRLFKIV